MNTAPAKKIRWVGIPGAGFMAGHMTVLAGIASIGTVCSSSLSMKSLLRLTHEPNTGSPGEKFLFYRFLLPVKIVIQILLLVSANLVRSVQDPIDILGWVMVGIL